MDKGEGEDEKTETRQDEENGKRIVAVQRACKSLHDWESHTEMRGMRLWLPSILI